MTTVCFASVANPGRIDNVRRLKVTTITGLVGSSYKYTSLQTVQNDQ